MTIEDWIKQQQAQGHTVSVVIVDRTTDGGILTTLDPLVMGDLQHADGAIPVRVKLGMAAPAD